jgi:hypothetical protein
MKALLPSELARSYNAVNNECERLQEALNKRRAENR